MQAQYYRDPDQLAAYLAANHFLTSINNEIPVSRNATYARNFAALDALVLVLFAEDRTVVPKESSWFGSYAPSDSDGDSSGRAERTVVGMRQHALYTEDWIGLKTLDDSGRVVLVECEGEHMQLGRKCWEPLVQKYTGSLEES